MKAVILAAGRGERMKPLTDQTPKPLLTIDGIPVIDQIISLLRESGINEISVVAGHLKEELLAHLDGQNINFCFQEQAIGTANALLCARKTLAGPFLSLAADTIFKSGELKSMIAYYNSVGPDILVGLREVPKYEIARRSTVSVKNGRILQIIEKPRSGKELSNISAMPIFMFNENIWDYLERVQPSSYGKYELANAIQAAIDDKLTVGGFVFGWAKDITYPHDVS